MSQTLSRHRTFSVFPASLISNQANMNAILENQLLFFVRNLFEAQGYIFVNLDQEPDFLVTLTASSEYKESYVPPQTVTVPKWVPGQTVTTYENSSGRFNYNTFGNYSSYGFGSYSGTSTSTTYIPGYVTSETYTQPGYNVGYYYPAVMVAALDAKTFQMIWLGSGAGTSINPDVRVSSQLVLSNMVSQFPAPTENAQPVAVNISGIGKIEFPNTMSAADIQRTVDQIAAYAVEGLSPDGMPPITTGASKDGVVGIGFGIFTSDGNNYLPTVTQLPDKSPAKQAGLKLYDMILSVDGTPMVNKSFAEIVGHLVGEPGSTVNLEVWRVDQRIPVTLTRVSRDEVD